MSATVFDSAVAGLLSSLSTGLFFPLEVLKVHLMVSEQRVSPAAVLKDLYRTGGLARLYRGWYLTTANSASWAVYFGLYQMGKTRIYGVTEGRHWELEKLAVAFQASALTTVIVNPAMVMKTRIMLLKYPQKWYQDILDSAMKIHLLEGWRGFFSGLIPALVLSLNGTLHLYFYETLKERYNPEGTNGKTTLIGAVSKLMSSALLHPMQTVKYRMQQEQHREFLHTHSASISTAYLSKPLFGSVWECITSTFLHEGIRGFYKGLLVNQLRLFPANGLFFLVYENVLKALKTQ